jgi:hypothetical protein
MADITALSDLLRECSTEDIGLGAEPAQAAPSFTPGSIGPPARAPVPQKQESGKSIWTDTEVPEQGDLEDPNDKRPPPR